MLSKARDQHGKKPELWLTLAALWEGADNPKEAERILLEAPDTVEMPLARIRLSSRTGEAANVETLKSLESGKEKFDADDQARLLYGLGTAYFQAGQPAEAQARLVADHDLCRAHGVNVRRSLPVADLAIQQNDAGRPCSASSTISRRSKPVRREARERFIASASPLARSGRRARAKRTWPSRQKTALGGRSGTSFLGCRGLGPRRGRRNPGQPRSGDRQLSQGDRAGHARQ